MGYDFLKTRDHVIDSVIAGLAATLLFIAGYGIRTHDGWSDFFVTIVITYIVATILFYWILKDKVNK